MKSIVGQNYAVQRCQPNYPKSRCKTSTITLEDATAIVEAANNTEDAWFYEMIVCQEVGQNKSRSS